MAEPRLATLLLQRVRGGDDEAASELFPLVYQELRDLATRYMARQAAGHTLQPTALVHEAWVKLVDVDHAQLADRVHFFRLAATAMRSVLVDHARGRRRLKRGGDRLRFTLDDAQLAAGEDDGLPDLLDLDAALSSLEEMDEQLARIVEYRFFAGLTNEETAGLLGVSSRTVERGWRVARAWLLNRLEVADGPDGGGST